MRKIQNAIKDYLKTNGISNEVLAEKCGWSEPRLSAFLNADHKLNSADYGKICYVLGVNYSTFYYHSKGIDKV